MNWNLSCPDWEQRLREGRPLVPDLPIYEEEAARAVAIFNKLRLYDVIGTPTMGEAGAEWFRAIVRALFGSLDPQTRQRMIREIFLLVPKKNNKTTGGGLLMLTALLLNQRPHAPFLLTAPVQKTADDAYSAISGAIALDPVLEAVLHVRDHLKTIVHRRTGAKLEIMTFDPEVVTGKKVVGALVDEYHLLGKVARAAKSMVQLRGGMNPFPEAFLMTITTQSDDAPAGVFAQDLTKARDIRDGKRQSRLLPVLYEFPMEMQQAPDKPWRDPKNWAMVTPNMGLSVQLETLREACDDAETKGEGDLRIWASQHLNIQIGVALHVGRWPGVDYWQACAEPGLTLQSVLDRSDTVMMGVDGGGLDDMLAVAVLGRDEITGEWLLWAKAWIHEKVLRERRKTDASLFEDFAADGDLVIIPDDSEDDVKQVAELAEMVNGSGKLQVAGLDTLGMPEIDKALRDAGLTDEQIGGVPQGYKLNGVIKTVERKLAARRLKHTGSRLLAWCIGNCKQQPVGNAVVITKQASGYAKIDPVMAALDAAYPMALQPEPVVYDDSNELMVV